MPTSKRKAIKTLEALLARCDTNADGGCWVWLRGKAHGYGTACFKGRSGGVHVHVYEAVRGAVPEGLELDHLCRNRACCNPAHLEAVTPKVNVLRGEAPAAVNARKVVCLKGHSLTGDNLYLTPDGRRQCRECKKASSLKYWNKQKVFACDG